MRFRSMRESLKLNKAELADALNFTSPTTITLFEDGASMPSSQSLIDLAERYPVDLHELLTGEPSPAIKTEIETLRELKHQTRLLLAQIKEATNQFGSTKKERTSHERARDQKGP